MLSIAYALYAIQTCIFPTLVTVCFDNSGFSRVVTLNSPGGVFASEVFPIYKQITMSNLFFPTFNLVGDLFVLPCVLHVNCPN